MTKRESDKIIVFERGNLLWIFNFHPTKSFHDYKVGAEWSGNYTIVLNSDNKRFGGHDRVNENLSYPLTSEPWNGRKNYIKVYI